MHSDLLKRLREEEDRTVTLCRELIRIPSEDPPGDTSEIAAYLRSHLEGLGFGVESHFMEPGRPNLVASLALGGPGPSLVFNGHMETLPVGDRARWKHDPFAATLEDGRIYGRGTWCMKGGIAAMSAAAAALAAHKEELGGTITLMFVSDEVNGGGKGTRFLLEKLADRRFDAALVGEGAEAILFGHKGPVFVEFRTTGGSGQSAYIFAAESANHRMSDLLADIRKLAGRRGTPPASIRSQIEASAALLNAEFGPAAADGLLSLTVNVGTLHGGRKVNLIAEECAAQVDFRLPPGMALAELRGLIDEVVAAHPGASYEFLWANEPAYTDPTHEWLRLLAETSREVYGRELDLRMSHGYTDARFFHLEGIPAAAIGRTGGVAGAPDEYIEVEGLLKSARLFALAGMKLLSGRDAEAPSSDGD